MNRSRRGPFPAAPLVRILGAAGLLTASAGLAYTQEPPTAPVPASLLAPKAEAPPPPLWSGEASLSFVQTTGNSENQTLGAAFKMLHQPAPWKLELRSAFLRTETADVTSAERLSGSLRAERSLAHRLAAFGQAGYLRDFFAGIAAQKTLEGGVVYKLLESERQLLAVSGALGYTRESRVAPAPSRDFLMGRTALAYRRRLGEASEFSNDLDYMANFKQSSDWRVANVAAFSASVSKVFALKLSHQLSYSHEPVPGKEITDTTFLASIVARWPK